MLTKFLPEARTPVKKTRNQSFRFTMRKAVLWVLMSLAACSAVILPSETLSQKVSQTSTSELCSAYFQPRTTTRGKLMIEAELAVRGTNRCAAGNYGRQSVSSIGTQTYVRGQSDLGVKGLDYDCEDFTSGAAAQKLFLAAGGPANDPHDLDRDGDGLACEWGTEIRKIAEYRPRPTISRPRSSSSICYTGPMGGTYTLTASGAKNYDGC